MDAATPHHDLLRYTIPPSAPSLLPSLASPAPSSCIPSHTVSTAPPQISLPPIDSGTGSMEQGGLEQEQELEEGVVPMEMHARVVPVLRTWPSSSSKKKKKKESGKTDGETQRSDDVRVERQITSKTDMDQRDSSKVPISKTVGGKRSLSHGSESSRARKAAKIINTKVEMTQLMQVLQHCVSSL